MLQPVLALFLLFAGVDSVSEGAAAESAIESPVRENSGFRLERAPVRGGAELITLFGRLQDPATGGERLDVPILSVLRDNLGNSDPENQRLRYIWILTSTKPTPLQRFASGLSFLYFRAGTKHHSNRRPTPVLDLASTGKTVWPNLLGKSLQATQLDPLGAMVRTSTRTYRGNSSDYRKLHLYQALTALEGLERSEDGRDLLPDSQLHEIYSRLSLSDRTFGGLVAQENLSPFFEKENNRRQETLGHNWELLRQRAEQAGLYFEPLGLPDAEPTQALLWVAREDLDRPDHPRFDKQFLNIANPWTDDRLTHWTGYRQIRYLDSDNRAATKDTPGARRVEMIPLAFYSLEHPRTPMLLADFRDSLKPKRTEMVRHGASSVVTGVFGITRFGSWPFFVGDSAYTFVRARHGAAVNASARLEAYSNAREFLAVDSTLDPTLKAELARRVAHLAVNPLENGTSTEATVANEQYAALLQYAGSENGLTVKLDRERRKELDSYTHSKAWRFFAGLGRFFTRGPHADPAHPDTQVRMELASYRRASYQMRFLEQVLKSSPRPEVVWDAEGIRRSVEALSADAPANPRAARLIARVFTSSSDFGLRFACLRALNRLEIEQAHNELWRLSQNPATENSWRAICMLYFKGNASTVPVTGLGGGE